MLKPRDLPLGRLPLHRVELPGVPVDVVDHDAVVAPVGAVGPLPAGVEGHVPRPGAAGHLPVGRVGRRDRHELARGVGRIPLPGPDPVGPQIRTEDELPVRGELDVVGVGRLLPGAVRAGAGDAVDVGRRAELAVALDGQHGEGALRRLPDVVPDHDEAPAGVGRHHRRDLPPGLLVVEAGEHPAGGVHREGGDAPGVGRPPPAAHLARGVEVGLRRIERQPGRVR
jgi:hypothetical protein